MSKSAIQMASLASIMALTDSTKMDYVDIEGLGRIYVKELSCEEKDSFETSLPSGDEAQTMTIRAPLVKASACDEDGNLIFSSVSLEKVLRLPASFIEPLFKKAKTLNGMDKSSVEQAEKN